MSFGLMRRFRVVVLAVILTVTSCHTKWDSTWEGKYLTQGQHYAVAGYNKDSRLVSRPIEQLRKDFRQADAEERPYTDVIVLVHGWNFTVPEAVAAFDIYARHVDHRLNELESISEGKRRPYILFVTWDSVSRPLTDLTSSILPLGLDEGAVEKVTTVLDGIVFHLPSVWGQSMNATEVAIGRGPADWYRDMSYDELMRKAEEQPLPDWFERTARKEEEGDVRPFKGTAISVAIILRELMELGLTRTYPDRFKLHVLGHSFGGKIATLASIESITSFKRHHPDADDDDTIDSLVVFNGAFHPEELEYLESAPEVFVERTGVISPTKIVSALATIERKAFVHTRYDSATGIGFGVTEVLIDKSHLQVEHQRFVAFEQDPMLPNVLYMNDISNFVLGALQLGYIVVASVASWTYEKVVHLPEDFGRHVTEYNLLGTEDGPHWLMYPFNAAHFFLPIDYFFPESPENSGGILEFQRTGVGFESMHDLVRKRDGIAIQAELRRMLPKSSQLNSESFIQMANGEIVCGMLDGWDPGAIYTFDASLVYDAWYSGHGDFRSLETAEAVDRGPLAGCAKRDITLAFAWNVIARESPELAVDNPKWRCGETGATSASE